MAAQLVAIRGSVILCGDPFGAPSRDILPVIGPMRLLAGVGLWPWWMAALFVIMGAEGGLAIAVWARGHWTRTAAILNTALAVLFVSWGLTLLGRGQLINSEFVELLTFHTGPENGVARILAVLLGFGIVGFSAWDAIDGWLKTRRAARSVAAA